MCGVQLISFPSIFLLYFALIPRHAFRFQFFTSHFAHSLTLSFSLSRFHTFLHLALSLFQLPFGHRSLTLRLRFLLSLTALPFVSPFTSLCSPLTLTADPFPFSLTISVWFLPAASLPTTPWPRAPLLPASCSLLPQWRLVSLPSTPPAQLGAASTARGPEKRSNKPENK